MNATPDELRPAAAPAPDGPAEGRPPATPADDDALLCGYGAALAEAVEAALGPWMAAAVQTRLGGPTPAPPAPGPGSAPDGIESALAAAVPVAVADIGGRLRDLLALDVDEQWTNPLSIIRQAVAYPTAILARAGLAPLVRDATDTRLHPDDLYGLVPATFADLGPEVHQRGLEWGAAKAHVHLRRRPRAVAP